MIERVTIQVNQETRDKIINFYGSIQKENKGQYILFFGQNKDLTVTVYSSKKEDVFKVFFIGEMALSEARRWDKEAKPTEPKENKAPTKASWEVLGDQIGSDEVGTGDFFGPICVCAAYVKASDIKRLKQLGVDSNRIVPKCCAKTWRCITALPAVVPAASSSARWVRVDSRM